MVNQVGLVSNAIAAKLDKDDFDLSFVGQFIESARVSSLWEEVRAFETIRHSIQSAVRRWMDKMKGEMRDSVNRLLSPDQGTLNALEECQNSLTAAF